MHGCVRPYARKCEHDADANADVASDLQNKELEATEERKRKAKQLEMQRKESARTGRAMGGGMGPRAPVYPTYTAPSRPAGTDSYDSYEAEKNKSKYEARPSVSSFVQCAAC